MKEKLAEISSLLSELVNNAGDNRGRDGEYLSDSAQAIQERVDALIDSM